MGGGAASAHGRPRGKARDSVDSRVEVSATGEGRIPSWTERRREEGASKKDKNQWRRMQTSK